MFELRIRTVKPLDLHALVGIHGACTSRCCFFGFVVTPMTRATLILNIGVPCKWLSCIFQGVSSIRLKRDLYSFVVAVPNGNV
jgi:hypothetical protein